MHGGLAGVHNSLGLATFWPFVLGLAGLAELRFFFGRLARSSYHPGRHPMAVLVTAMGIDYFSPQSAGYVLGAALFGIPWLAALAMVAVGERPPSWVTGVSWHASLGLAATFLVASFVLDDTNVIRSSDLSVLQAYERHARPAATCSTCPTATSPPASPSPCWRTTSNGRDGTYLFQVVLRPAGR